MATSLMDIDPTAGDTGVVNAIIEIPKGRRNKFEYDKKLGVFKLDRHLYSSSFYPGDYGFVPQTLAEDGDPLDVLVMVNEATFPGCLIETRIIGLFKMQDRGDNDYKLLGVPNNDPLFDEFTELAHTPKHFLREVSHFFETYKQLEGVEVVAQGWDDKYNAVSIVDAAIERFKGQK